MWAVDFNKDMEKLKELSEFQSWGRKYDRKGKSKLLTNAPRKIQRICKHTVTQSLELHIIHGNLIKKQTHLVW